MWGAVEARRFPFVYKVIRQEATAASFCLSMLTAKSGFLPVSLCFFLISADKLIRTSFTIKMTLLKELFLLFNSV